MRSEPEISRVHPGEALRGLLLAGEWQQCGDAFHFDVQVTGGAPVGAGAVPAEEFLAADPQVAAGGGVQQRASLIDGDLGDLGRILGVSRLISHELEGGAGSARGRFRSR